MPLSSLITEIFRFGHMSDVIPKIGGFVGDLYWDCRTRTVLEVSYNRIYP